MTPEVFIKANLAALAHREAFQHGGVNNMLGVMFVMRNRVRAGWHNGDWMKVLQYHSETAAWLYPAELPIDLRDLNFRMVLQQVDDLFSGIAVDHMTEGALFYCELNRVHSEWFLKNVVGDPANHPRVANVGNVSFFR